EERRSEALLAAAATLSCALRAGRSTSRRSVDLPEPLTPVMQTNRPKGISTLRFFRLCRLAPQTLRDWQGSGGDADVKGASFNWRAAPFPTAGQSKRDSTRRLSRSE